MIVVTGAAGFIGSNIVRALNAHGVNEVVAVDDLEDGRKFENLVKCDLLDYWDVDRMKANLEKLPHDLAPARAIIHHGACSDTTQWNGKFMLENNFEVSKYLLHYCMERGIPYIYASSAAVYGYAREFSEHPRCEGPVNLYGYSKLLFDRYVRRYLPRSASQIVGLRYFNVYGPGEAHKGTMASVGWHFREQITRTGVVRLFEGSHGYPDGEQRRDFVYVDDAAAVVRWFAEHPGVSGIYNVGSGRAHAFNDVARAVIAWNGAGEIEYIPFPEHLKGRYQAFTEADLSALRGAGCPVEFRAVSEGVQAYMLALDRSLNQPLDRLGGQFGTALGGQLPGQRQ